MKPNKRSKHTLYIFEIVGPEGDSFRLQDRYSRIRQFVNIIIDNLNSKEGLPAFPEKRIFNAMNKEFVQNRSKQLEQFLNQFLNHQEVKNCRMTSMYFNSYNVQPEEFKAGINEEEPAQL